MPIDGVKQVLDTLLQKQIAICIAANAPHEKMAVTLSLTKLATYFTGRIFSAFDANAWKRNPALIHFVMDKMAVEAPECLFIDDSPVGVEAGVKAGVTTCYFAHAAPDDEPFTAGKQLFKINALTELLNYI